MPQIAVRLSREELRMLDETVSKGAFRSRAHAVRAGIRLLKHELRETRIGASYRSAYADEPPSAEEARMLDAALALALEDAPR